MSAFQVDSQVVCLTTAPNPRQAHIWHDALHAEGIHSHVVCDYRDLGSDDTHGIEAEIWVTRQDIAQAKRLLGRSST